MNLLSTVTHEFGHILGRQHNRHGSVMQTQLHIGESFTMPVAGTGLEHTAPSGFLEPFVSELGFMAGSSVQHMAGWKADITEPAGHQLTTLSDFAAMKSTGNRTNSADADLTTSLTDDEQEQQHDRFFKLLGSVNDADLEETGLHWMVDF